MQISDVSKRPTNRKGCAIRAGVMRPVSHCQVKRTTPHTASSAAAAYKNHTSMSF